MVPKKRYEYSPLEEIFFPKRTPNVQCHSDEDAPLGDERGKRRADINRIKDSLLQPELSLELCQRKKNYYNSTRHASHVQSYLFFYDYRKCFHNLEGKIFIDGHPVRIWDDGTKRDPRLKEDIPVQNYNSFVYAYNL
ncbi:hypothetical protein PVMG_03991 [Plasmodium vivax Mauritania I]|uniref:Uncharacterized protein n=1 Tax=Plasmodium vivax Mauritania I TaxID=1035515 RepID=A0A0J9TME7_PLAVI|nr:hypothetical protein PVMG_03991 [Plasmodium vivax Mauritania I]